MNIINKNFHAYLAERSIRTVKERCHYTVQSLSFSYFLAPLLVNIICNIISNLNIFPGKGGICNNISPITFITGVVCPDYNNITLLIREYAEVYKDNNY